MLLTVPESDSSCNTEKQKKDEHEKHFTQFDTFEVYNFEVYTKRTTV